MSPQRSISHRAIHLLDVIPADDFITEAALAALAEVDDRIEVIDGRVTALRALRSAGAITIRRHPDGYLLYACTPTGTRILEGRPCRTGNPCHPGSRGIRSSDQTGKRPATTPRRTA